MSTSMPAIRIVEEITIDAPAERVFDAFLSPEARIRWWNVAGRFRTTTAQSDLRPGGRWSMQGIGMNDRPFTLRGEYRIVNRPTLVEFTWLPDWQDEAIESIVRVEFEETAGVTRVRLTHSGLTEGTRNNHRGWPQVLAALGQHVVQR